MSSFVVTVGGVQRTSTETGEITQTSTLATLHEKYDENWLTDDIAVIKMPKPFTLSKHFQAVSLFVKDFLLGKENRNNYIYLWPTRQTCTIYLVNCVTLWLQICFRFFILHFSQ
jgi:hypothetical protein